ncbi:cupin domain-containing protein [Burkholderia sp. BCC0405]|uniref:cupin domain-containing protein n=1 Tax=Burkholderia sp. BCC0405 TaxID=2676298 RepID=UPI00158AC1E3|nr:cupin domain-containing protein [Burkholderia sp. BCC0405]
MALIDFRSVAAAQAVAWKSTIVGEVGPARIKVLRMDAQAYEAEVHDYNEGLLVLDGRMMLEVGGETVVVEAGQMYLALAGTLHAVLPGSHGTLAIIDV